MSNEEFRDVAVAASLFFMQIFNNKKRGCHFLKWHPRARVVLSLRRTFIMTIAVLFSNLAIDAVNTDFLSIILGYRFRPFYSFLLRSEVAGTTFGFFLNSRPMTASLNNVYVFTHSR